MIKNILLTGANGQLGNEITQLIPLFPHYSFLLTDIDTLDLTNISAVQDFLKKNRVDYLINCAAYTAVDRAEDDIELCYKINRDAVNNLAEVSPKETKIIHVSTDYVFNGRGNTPLKETDLTDPHSVYGKSKLEGELLLQEKAPNSIIVRTSWLYSTFGNNFVKTMIRLGREKEEIKVVDDQIGTPTYAADLASAIMKIIEKSEKENFYMPGIYHYSNEGICSWYDFCLKIFEFANVENCKVHPIPTSDYPTKAQRPMYSVLDKSKIKQTFNLEIPQWEESLKKCVNILMS